MPGVGGCEKITEELRLPYCRGAPKFTADTVAEAVRRDSTLSVAPSTPHPSLHAAAATGQGLRAPAADPTRAMPQTPSSVGGAYPGRTLPQLSPLSSTPPPLLTSRAFAFDVLAQARWEWKGLHLGVWKGRTPTLQLRSH